MVIIVKETWATKFRYAHKLNAYNMRIIRWVKYTQLVNQSVRQASIKAPRAYNQNKGNKVITLAYA